MTSKAPVQKREFRLDKHALTSLIQAQAGSVEKALLEAVANAIDANASQVELTVSPTHISITDNGRGFASIEEIDKFFDTFGFDHSQLDRKVGRFGVGRGQLFHFGKNLWTTHGHTMAVDTRSDGFGYDLGEAESPHKGVKIEIELYQPLSFSEVASLEAGFKKLVKYSTIPVIFNGEEVQRNPDAMKWEVETADAWMKFDESQELKVYSQGLYVQSIPAYRYGKGGTIVTKMGKPLAQNMARNDLLTTDCPVWKRVVKDIGKLARGHQEQAKKTGGAMTEAMRASIAKRALFEEGEEAFELLTKTPLFTLANGKHIRLEQMLSTGYISVSQGNDPAADLFIQRKQAMVITHGTVSRLGAGSVSGVLGLARAAIERHKEFFQKARMDAHGHYAHYSEKDYRRTQEIHRIEQAIKECKAFDRLSELPMNADISLNEIKPSEYLPEEKQMMSMLRKSTYPWVERAVYYHLDQQAGRHEPRASRSLALASSEAFLACTDGATKIWIERKHLRQCMRQGLQGFTALVNLLVHEILHDIDTSTGHTHDHAFYEAYHDITLGGLMGTIATNEYRAYLRKGGTANPSAIKTMEQIQEFGGDDIQARMSALKKGGEFEEVQEDAQVPTKSNPRRRAPK